MASIWKTRMEVRNEVAKVGPCRKAGTITSLEPRSNTKTEAVELKRSIQGTLYKQSSGSSFRSCGSSS